ncbi:MAG: M20 family metallopeptidase [Candidatus Levyibacteriota bacterium]
MTKQTKEQTNIPIQDIISLAKQFITISSTANNSAALEEIISIASKGLTDFVMETFVADGKPSLLIHNAKRGTKKFTIIFNAHLDVVPGNEAQFVPRIKDGKLFGRGAYDMKAAAAVMISLFKELAKKITYPLALQLVTDEELADGKGTRSQLDTDIQTDMAIVGECGSNLAIIHENKGLLHAYLTTKGSTAHGAYLWKGDNAITKMHRALAIIYKHFPTPTTETFDSTVNVSQISTTNDMWNLVPDNCTATLDIRVNREDKKMTIEKIRKILPHDVTLVSEKTRNPHYTDPNHKYIKLLQNAAVKASERDITLRKTFGGSDAVFFSDRGYDAIEFGPVGYGQHSSNEWVDIMGLGDYYQILKQFLLEIDAKETMIK